ncbi:GGDEF domain-containing protein [Undibacterium crateris]|uniref:GGDEF domain-containing protein n=1 Tax=Undibacterium crateris TaxID=2528175 RepID=UPI0013895293|nr:GGDEF domain-containing protein [Undibacterium crateris]NDI87598.1 diguanylate cyclase [Undibacterium crateris]
MFFLIVLITSGAKISIDIEEKIKSQINLEAQVRRNEWLALTDDLTKIGNRRFFNLTLKKISDANNLELVSILVLDIDHFKKINDNYGHDIGDLVLKQVAEVVATTLAPAAYFARVGGEEFGVILRGKSAQDAMLIADKIVFAVSKHSFTCKTVEIWPVTLSVGVSSTRLPKKIYKVYKYADMALYKAKSLGRNCVVLGDVINY